MNNFQYYIPQANDVAKLFSLVDLISKGVNIKKDLSNKLNVDERQVDYYAEACKNLRLINKKSGIFNLTDEGKFFVTMTETDQFKEIALRMLKLPLFSEILVLLITSDDGVIEEKELENILCEKPSVSVVTIERRMSTIIRWLEWIGDNFGCIKVENKRIFISKKFSKEKKLVDLI